MIKLLKVLPRLGPLRVISDALQKLGLLKITFRAYERLIAMDIGGSKSQALQTPADNLPLPPTNMIVLVSGSPDIDWFLEAGRATFEGIINTLQNNGVRVETLEAVLDFGCGCGRVLRHWSSVHGPGLHGVDYNPLLLDWCRRSLPFAKFVKSGLHPPLLYADGAFDFVHAISVFTHMSQELQLSWMRELRRVIRPGGYLLITTQGESFRKRLTRREREAFDAGNVVVRYEDASGMNLCSVYHPETYVRQQLSAGYKVEDFIPVGAQRLVYQDLYLMRKIETV